MRRLIALGLLFLCAQAYAGPVGPPAGSPIINTNRLQSGATFYVSSGTVAGPLVVGTTAEVNYGNIQMDIERTPDSSAITATDSGNAGNLNGSYLYRVVFVTANGDTGSSWNQTSNLVAVTNHSVNLTNIPTGTSKVLSRGIYRTDALNSSISPFLMWLVGTINDNTTTTFTDNVADSVLTTSATIPVRNTTGAGIFLKDSSGENNQNFEADDQGTYLGHWAGRKSHGYSNTFIGNDSGLQNTTGYWNVCVGHETCENNTGGNSNTFVGLKSGYLETTGVNNTAIGEDSLNQGTTFQSCVAVGYHAGFQNNANQNVFVGANAGQSITNGSGNTLLGTSAASGGSANPITSVVIGLTAATNLQSVNNVIIGNTAGSVLTTGGTNVLVGANSGSHLITGANNTMLGHDSGFNSTGSGNIYLGYFGGWKQTGESNIFMVDNQARSTESEGQQNAIIYSTMSATWQNQAMNINTGNLTTPGALSVGYNISAGSMTGAGLTTCGDATHALAWSSANNLFTCQSITGTGGGGGSSALAVGIGSATWTSQISSPTAAVDFDRSQFNGSLQGGATAFISVAYSSNSITGSYTTVSTDTFVNANCASACTVTLGTPVFSGKVLMVAQTGAGNVTLSPASGNISGGSTALMNQQYSELDVLWDGKNWWVK